MSIKLTTKGFESLLEDVKIAGGSVDQACESALKQSAVIMQNELKAEMRSSGVDGGLIESMPKFTVEKEGNEYTARVGYRKGAYDPENLSDGYKVVFLNYGTPNRTKHGKIVDVSEGGKIHLGFIQRAKAAAQPKMRKEQRKALKKIIERLK